MFNGYQEPAVTWLYRKHPDQTTHPSKPNVWGEQQDRFIRQRLDAARATGLAMANGFPSVQPRGDVESG